MGTMFGIEANKYFGSTDSMKDEAFRQQQRAVAMDKKKEVFRVEIEKKI